MVYCSSQQKSAVFEFGQGCVSIWSQEMWPGIYILRGIMIQTSDASLFTVRTAQDHTHVTSTPNEAWDWGDSQSDPNRNSEFQWSKQYCVLLLLIFCQLWLMVSVIPGFSRNAQARRIHGGSSKCVPLRLRKALCCFLFWSFPNSGLNHGGNVAESGKPSVVSRAYGISNSSLLAVNFSHRTWMLNEQKLGTPPVW